MGVSAAFVSYTVVTATFFPDSLTLHHAHTIKQLIHINRITVEFKTLRGGNCFFFPVILIESQWNLKGTDDRGKSNSSFILIESQWNLKRTNRI